MSTGKSYTLNQLNGRIGELEFALLLEKMNFSVNVTDAFFSFLRERKAKLFPIAIQGSSDHGIDFDTELCWVDENGNSTFTGLHIFVQVKTYKRNINFKAKDIEYYERLSAFVPVLVIWQNFDEDGEIIFRRVISYSKIKLNKDVCEKIQDVRCNKQDKACINIKLWENFDEKWCQNYVEGLLDEIERRQLDGFFSSTLLSEISFLEGILSSCGYSFLAGEEKKYQYMYRIYEKEELGCVLIISFIGSDHILLPDPTSGNKLVRLRSKFDWSKFFINLIFESEKIFEKKIRKVIFSTTGGIFENDVVAEKALASYQESLIYNCKIFKTDYHHARKNVESIKEFLELIYEPIEPSS